MPGSIWNWPFLAYERNTRIHAGAATATISI
jgi:hypothetical protein